MVIEALHRSTGGAVALITGRRIADVDRLFPGIRLAAAGQHGVERRNSRGHISRHPFLVAQLDSVRLRLADAVARYPQLLLEDKGMSLALHYRAAPRLASYAHWLMRSVAASLGKPFCVQTGKRVVEIRPNGENKGTAIEAFMKEPSFRGRIPVFLGDDTTDEYGFGMVNQLGGHSVKVGTGPTVAHWRLRDVDAVGSWLRRGRPAPRPTR